MARKKVTIFWAVFIFILFRLAPKKTIKKQNKIYIPYLICYEDHNDSSVHAIYLSLESGHNKRSFIAPDNGSTQFGQMLAFCEQRLNPCYAFPRWWEWSDLTKAQAWAMVYGDHPIPRPIHRTDKIQRNTDITFETGLAADVGGSLSMLAANFLMSSSPNFPSWFLPITFSVYGYGRKAATV